MTAREPRLGCGAAIIRNREILLIRRLREPEAGCWGLPGGKVDWLEPIEQAVRREIVEELGIMLRQLDLLCVVDQIDRQKSEHWVAPVYLCESFDGDARLLEPEKHSASGWFPLKALPEPLTVATRAAIAAWRNGHAVSRGLPGS